jgi:hypothetical protein
MTFVALCHDGARVWECVHRGDIGATFINRVILRPGFISEVNVTLTVGAARE